MQGYMEREKYDLEIELRLLTEEEGGRRTGICSGYRCTIDLAGTCWVTEFHLSDFTQEFLNPGETGRVLVFTTFPTLLLEHLTLETPLLLREGGRLVGRGRIIEFLNLKNHAEQARQQEEEQAKRHQKKEKETLSQIVVPHLSARPYTHKKKQQKNK